MSALLIAVFNIRCQFSHLRYKCDRNGGKNIIQCTLF